MDPRINVTVDLRNLDWQLLDHMAKQKPMDVARVREQIRQQILAVAAANNLPKLSAWATGLTNSALDYLTHFGFLESHFWQGVTGDPGPKGYVAFVGPDEPPKEGESKSGTATDGQNKGRLFTLKKAVEPHV